MAVVVGDIASHPHGEIFDATFLPAAVQCYLGLCTIARVRGKDKSSVLALLVLFSFELTCVSS